MSGETADVHLVDYCLHERTLERLVALPVIRNGIGNDTLHRGGSFAVCATVRLRNGDGTTIGVERHAVTIETQAAPRVERAQDSEAIDLTGHDVRNKDVPVVIGTVRARIKRNYP
jgi:hypothetical protein